jgi:periplasmic copper chaperone A
MITNTRRNRATRAAGLTVALALVLAALAASAPAATAGAPGISGVWARTSTGMMGAAYLTIKGAGTADRLVAASAPTSVAKTTELHKTVMDSGGMMSMKPVKSIAIPATGTVTLKPGGYHVMLINLKKPLTAGARFPLTLTFAKSGKKTVTVTVRKS